MPTLPAFRSRSLDDLTSRRVIAALDAVGAGRSTVVLPVPSVGFRADLRAQLVAVAPRLVAEGVHADTEAPPRHATTAAGAGSGATSKAGATARRPVRTRPMTVLVAGTAVVVLGMGGATWLARGALPGDALYGLKRTAESVDVSLSGSDLDKGHALLLDATTRVQEVNDLLNRPQSMAFGTGPSASGALNDATVTLIVSTLQAADADTHKGVTTIGDDAITRGDTAGLELVVVWADGQRTSIAQLVGDSRIPAGAAKTQAQTSAAEINAGLDRATLLLAEVKAGTTCTDRQRDEFGPEPCGAAATPAPTAPASSAPGTGGGGSTGSPGGGSAPATTPATSAPAPTPAAMPSAATTSATASTPGAATPAVSLPVAVDTCGVQVSLPVVGVSLGACPPSP